MSSAPGAQPAPGSNTPETNQESQAPGHAPDATQTPLTGPDPTDPDAGGPAATGPAATGPAAAGPATGASAAGETPRDQAGDAPAGTSDQAAAEPPSERAAGARRGIPRTFSSLRVRNYRLFATGSVISNTGTWMMRIAQDWLVLSLTGSSTAVGVTTALQFLPMLLFGLYGGVIADRYSKRALLFFTQTSMCLFSLVLAALTLTGQVQVWHVYLIAFLMGVSTVVDNPTRQSFVVEMVGPEEVRNAVSLNSANFQTARLVGPAVAGLLINAVGSGWAFLFNGVSFAGPLIALMLMRPAELHHVERVPRRAGQLREGLHYVAGRPDLIWPIVLIGFIGTFGFNFPIWLSAFAHTVFHAGAGTYGVLNTAMALGSLVGALLAARRVTARGRILLGAAVLFGVLEMVAALSPELWLFTLLLVLVGTFGITVNTTANSTVQLATDPAMRGRVMSLFMMVFVGGTPLGGPLVGWITDTYGARIGFLLGGLVSTLSAVTIAALLIRAGGMRLTLDRTGGRRRLSLTPRAAALSAAVAASVSPPRSPEAAVLPTAAPADAPRAVPYAGDDQAPESLRGGRGTVRRGGPGTCREHHEGRNEGRNEGGQQAADPVRGRHDDPGGDEPRAAVAAC